MPQKTISLAKVALTKIAELVALKELGNALGVALKVLSTFLVREKPAFANIAVMTYNFRVTSSPSSSRVTRIAKL